MQLPKRNIALIVVAAIIALVGLGFAGSAWWYNQQLQPVDVSNEEKVRIDIGDGASASQIAATLKEKKAIKNETAFMVYVRLHGVGGQFQKGVYSVSPSQNIKEIVLHLTSGRPDERSITFFPGAVLRDTTTTPEAKKTDVTTVLKRAGFSESEITKALTATYDSPVLKDKPADADLEGYIYGDTYFISVDATPEQIIQRAIDEMASVVAKNNLEQKFATRNLTLYQGITLASIVQRESIGCPGKTVCEDQQQIASVFFNRLAQNMPLGSDVTYHYAADKQGVARDYTLNSPYNTRIHPGLPPGPIATPGVSALNAVADPAQTDYLYFLSGDDDVTYFGRTNDEHEANIRSHCAEKCLLP